MGIFDLDDVGAPVSSIPYVGIGAAVLDAEGDEINERTLKQSTRVLIPHPHMHDRLMPMVLRKRSADGNAVAYGYGLAAMLMHDDEQGWTVAGLLDEREYEEVTRAAGV